MKAFDVHVHPSTRGLDHHACGYFRRNLNDIPQTPEGFAALYAKNDVQALLIGWHPSTVNEGARNSNEHVLDLANQFARRNANADPMAVFGETLAPIASEETRRTITRAESRPQALALLFMSPEFQRR